MQARTRMNAFAGLRIPGLMPPKKQKTGHGNRSLHKHVIPCADSEYGAFPHTMVRFYHCPGSASCLCQSFLGTAGIPSAVQYSEDEHSVLNYSVIDCERKALGEHSVMA